MGERQKMTAPLIIMIREQLKQYSQSHIFILKNQQEIFKASLQQQLQHSKWTNIKIQDMACQ